MKSSRPGSGVTLTSQPVSDAGEGSGKKKIEYFTPGSVSADKSPVSVGDLTSSAKKMLQLIAKNARQITDISQFELGREYVICCPSNPKYHGKIFTYDAEKKSLNEVNLDKNSKPKTLLKLNSHELESKLKNDDVIIAETLPDNQQPAMG